MRISDWSSDVCSSELKSLREAIPPAVDEVGGPTILATFTVIAALLPMAFVSGLMGPYMRPIPINASAGMLLSLMIALIVTSWLSLKLLKRHDDDGAEQAPATDPSGEGAVAQGNMGPGDTNVAGQLEHGAQAPATLAARLHRFFERVMSPFLAATGGARRRQRVFASMAGLALLAVGRAAFELAVKIGR